MERRQLAFAIDHQVPVSITYQAASGGTTTRTISDIELINGMMYAWCHLRDDERVFSVDRVQAVVPVHADPLPAGPEPFTRAGGGRCPLEYCGYHFSRARSVGRHTEEAH